MDSSPLNCRPSPSVRGMTRYVVHPPGRSRIFLVSFAVLATMGLTGCSTFAEPAPAQEALVVEATPMFASDAEASAAAEAAYRNYIDVSDQIARDGGANPERLEALVSQDLYSQQLEEYGDVLAKGLRATGASTFDSFKLESYDPYSGEIRVYVCIRVSSIRVVSKAGADVTPVERPDDLPLQVTFVRESDTGAHLSISASDVWSGKNFC